MKIIKSIALLILCAVGQLPVTTYAQINPNNPLVVFVENTPGTTMLQQAVRLILIVSKRVLMT